MVFLEGACRPRGEVEGEPDVLHANSPYTTTARAPRQHHQHHQRRRRRQLPMHALLWVLVASVTILLLGGIIATYHYHAGIAHRRATEQREQRFLADASELEQLRGGQARRGESLLDLSRYR